MRVLLSAGENTQNIVDLLHKKFELNGDDLIIVPYIEDIGNVYQLGNYFDKAIIVDLSITRKDENITDIEIRDKIGAFAGECLRRNNDEKYIFVTSNEDIANMIYEEAINISDKSVILYKPDGRYKVHLFAKMITNDIDNMPEELVFKPKELEVINNGMHIDSSDEFDNYNESINAPKSMFDGPENEVDNSMITDINPEDIEGEPLDIEGEPLDIEGEPLDIEGEPLDIEGEPLDIEGEPLDIEGEPLDIEGDNDIFKSDIQDLDNGYIPEELDNKSFEFDTIPEELEGEPFDFEPAQTELEGEPFDFEPAQTELEGESFDFHNIQEESEGEPFDIDDISNKPITELEDGIDESQINNNENFENFENWGDYIPNEDIEVEQPVDNIVPVVSIKLPNKNNDTEQVVNDENQQHIINESDYDDTPSNKYDTYENVNQSTQINNGYQQNYNNQQYQGQNIVNNNSQVQFMPDNSDYIDPELDNRRLVQDIQPNIHANNNDILRAFAARGNNICVTGCGGCGTSTIAFNIANCIANIGYTVLLVDFDTETRTQNYLSLNSYKNMDPSGSNLMAAVNSGQGIKNLTTIIKPGLHLLTMGIGGDTAKPDDLLNENKINRFINIVKSMYNFVIYDVPFESATGFLQETVYLSDNLVLVTEMSTHGIMKTMLKVCNIQGTDMQEAFFNKAQIVFNKNRNFKKLLGKKIKNINDIIRIMDEKIIELTGNDNGTYFSEMHVAGVINDDPDYELAWFEDVQYSDTNKGMNIYRNLVNNIITYK